MLLLGQDVLRRAGRKNNPLRLWLEEWTVIVLESHWASLSEVRRIYPAADGVKLKSGTVLIIFNVKGNEYRLLSWIDYESGVVEALEILTHAQYDKNQWKLRY